MAVDLDQEEVSIPQFNHTFKNIREVVGLLQKKGVTLNGETLKLVRAAELPNWVLLGEFMETSTFLCENSGLHAIYNGKLFGKIPVIIKIAHPKQNYKMMEKANRTLMNETVRTMSFNHPNIVLVRIPLSKIRSQYLWISVNVLFRTTVLLVFSFLQVL